MKERTNLMDYETITLRVEAGKVGIVALHRPKQLNALNDQLMDELGDALKALDQDGTIGCIVLTGSEKAFVMVQFVRTPR
jgi:enoyl-CoA hydratase